MSDLEDGIPSKVVFYDFMIFTLKSNASNLQRASLLHSLPQGVF